MSLKVLETPLYAQSVTDAQNLLAASFQAPQVNWTIDPKVQDGCRKVAFALAAVWVIWVAAKFAIPSQRSGMMGQGGGGIGRFILAGIPILILLDLDLVKTLVNWMLQGFWAAGSALGLI